jgi:HAD superfamily 5'-nucleotidase-like hydrolase
MPTEPEKLFRPPPPNRRVFCNRTLNLRATQAVGYDMDYTLIHYCEEEWELRAYEHVKESLSQKGWPVQELTFQAHLMERGLVLDIELGNILEANRFGFVKQAYHGTHPIDYREVREVYARTIVDLAEPRFVFLNTLFSLSEGCIYAQLVDLLDRQALPPRPSLGYSDLYNVVRDSLSRAHAEGQIKQEIARDPDRFVVLDPETPLALLDQKRAGKRVLLITNSGWHYSRDMMSYAFDRFLPEDMTWKDLFDLIIVSARKPDFFASRNPFFEVVDEEEGLLQPTISGLKNGGVYVGGNAHEVEQFLGLQGREILYVGDHIFGDVHVTKKLLRWRTALVLRELELEIAATEAFAQKQERLSALMTEKEDLEFVLCQLRVARMRLDFGYGPAPEMSLAEMETAVAKLKQKLAVLDPKIAPLAKSSSELSHPLWGPLLRAGNDKSLLTRQLERSADIYTSRVSNFLYQTPFAYLRSKRSPMPHDPS